MTQKNNRKRRGPVKNATAAAAAPDRYQKYLPEWMRGTGTPVVRPPRPKRARAPRPAGGYTPGKYAVGDPLA